MIRRVFGRKTGCRVNVFVMLVAATASWEFSPTCHGSTASHALISSLISARTCNGLRLKNKETQPWRSLSESFVSTVTHRQPQRAHGLNKGLSKVLPLPVQPAPVPLSETIPVEHQPHVDSVSLNLALDPHIHPVASPAKAFSSHVLPDQIATGRLSRHPLLPVLNPQVWRSLQTCQPRTEPTRNAVALVDAGI